MPKSQPEKPSETGSRSRPEPVSDFRDKGAVKTPLHREIGGRGGLDPTRYGDWEKAGRCIDF